MGPLTLKLPVEKGLLLFLAQREMLHLLFAGRVIEDAHEVVVGVRGRAKGDRVALDAITPIGNVHGETVDLIDGPCEIDLCGPRVIDANDEVLERHGANLAERELVKGPAAVDAAKRVRRP